MSDMVDTLEAEAKGGPDPAGGGTDRDTTSSSGADTDGGGVGSPRISRVPGLNGRDDGAGPSNITLRIIQSDDQMTREIKQALGGAEAEIGSDKSKKKVERAANTRNVMRTAFSKIKTALQIRNDQRRNTLDLDESVPLAVPATCLEKGPAMEVCSRIARRLKRVAVSWDARYTSGGLEFTAAGNALIEAATKPAPSVPGVINPGKAPLLYGQTDNTPHIAQALAQASKDEAADIRELAPKVALLDIFCSLCKSIKVPVL